jgi:hypothetical protein
VSQAFLLKIPVQGPREYFIDQREFVRAWPENNSDGRAAVNLGPASLDRSALHHHCCDAVVLKSGP